MSSFASHFTREKANEGIICNLDRPDGVQEGWLRILSVDSDIFRKTDTELRRRAFKIAADAKKDGTLMTAFYEEQRFELLACLIAGWSFDEPCDQDNKIKLLREAPQIADFIDRVSVRRSSFFMNPSTDLKPLPETNLS